ELEGRAEEQAAGISKSRVIQRQRAKEAFSRLASLVESSDDAIVSMTLEAIIVTWNLGAERIYGYSAAEAEGRSLSILVPPDRPDDLPQILERIKLGER